MKAIIYNIFRSFQIAMFVVGVIMALAYLLFFMFTNQTIQPEFVRDTFVHGITYVVAYIGIGAITGWSE